MNPTDPPDDRDDGPAHEAGGPTVGGGADEAAAWMKAFEAAAREPADDADEEEADPGVVG